VTGVASAREPGAPPGGPYTAEVVARLLDEALDSSGGLPVEAGDRVLIKPNWVLHRNLGGGGTDCLHTSPLLVLAVLRRVLSRNPSSVVIGDAPVQGCEWKGIVTAGLMDGIRSLDGRGIVSVRDFRRTVTRGRGLYRAPDADARPEDAFVLLDLGNDSLLEPVSEPGGLFRVTMYDPRLLARRHLPGRHQYLIAREALEADRIIGLPKLKTHRKTGVTGALKNLVGLNGNKEFLPHHRAGGTGDGGDCYPGRSPLKRLAERLLDRANERAGTAGYAFWISAARAVLSLRGAVAGEAGIDGGWSGNDTVWRTVLDIDRIALYGRADGTMSDSPARTVFSIVDALVCGQGDGPLSPSPLDIGVITASDCMVESDEIGCALLGISPDRVPLVREASGDFRWPLRTRPAGSSAEAASRASALGSVAVAPCGWEGIQGTGGVSCPTAP